MSDSTPSSPPCPGTTSEESIKFYKSQYELLEAELAEFQASSKDLEAELEKDIEAAEKRERQLKEKASSLQYEVDEWKEKYKQAKSEASTAQNALQKEVTKLRDDNRTLHVKLRDIEVANDDFERQQRNTESSLEDVQQQYNQAFEKAVLFEQEVQKVEQEREDLRVDMQRLKDEFQDFKIEAEITKEKLRKADEVLKRRSTLSTDIARSAHSPRSDLSPTTTSTSSPSFDTPPAKTASSSGVSDTRTPPSPPISEKSSVSTKQLVTPHQLKSRMTVHTTPRQPTYTSRPSGHSRGLSSAVTIRTGPTYRQSLSKSTTSRPSSLPQSSSIMQLRNLRGKMQSLEQRVQKARSRLPAPTDTPPRASPRSESTRESIIPSSVTLRSRKRTTVSHTAGSQTESDIQSTPSISRTRSSRQSLSQQFQSAQTSPTRNMVSTMAMPPPRPSSRASGVSSRNSNFVPSHSRPGSRAGASVSLSSNTGHRPPLGAGASNKFIPNASTDRVVTRPHSSLSDYNRSRPMYDGAFDEDQEDVSLLEDSMAADSATATPTPRRSIARPRTSDVSISSSIPSPVKRQSLSTMGGIGFNTTGTGRLPAPTRRQSHSNLIHGGNTTARENNQNALLSRSTSKRTDVSTRPYEVRHPIGILSGVKEFGAISPKAIKYDVNETF